MVPRDGGSGSQYSDGSFRFVLAHRRLLFRRDGWEKTLNTDSVPNVKQGEKNTVQLDARKFVRSVVPERDERIDLEEGDRPAYHRTPARRLQLPAC